MAIIIDNQIDGAIDDKYITIINQIIQEVIDFERFPYEYEVSIVITSNDEIKQINNEYRGLDKATDVLSFPLIEFDVPANFDFIEGNEEYFDLDSDNVMLGDIVLSYERMLEQAKEYGHSNERELAFLMTHGMLHLLGYDHMEENEKVEMFKKQDEILEKAGFSR